MRVAKIYFIKYTKNIIMINVLLKFGIYLSFGICDLELLLTNKGGAYV